jgi:hypothetical protein
MLAPIDCPGMDGWQALFDDRVSPDRRADYERHLESCAACQDRLREAEQARDGLRELGRAFGDPTAVPADPTLGQFLGRLREPQLRSTLSLVRPGDASAAERAEAVDLDFLEPAGRSDLLGALDGYEVREVLGQGGMGVVLKAFDPALDRLVAIKVLAPALAGSATARRRFTREAQAAAAVRHDHVVTVHGVHEADGLPYLVMQYVAGESLQHRLDRTGPLELTEAVRIGHQTALGLAAAHAQGLIHRDVKPANLLLEGGPAKVKITDFGLARAVDDVGLTQQGVVAGTPEYMAPEQARSEPLDQRSDLFSLGAVLYACCTGVPPFRGSTALAVLRRVSDEPPPPLRERNPAVPTWLEAVIARLLAKDPADRFQTAAEVAGLLEGHRTHLRPPVAVPAPGRPPSSPGRFRGRAGRGLWRFWPLALLLLAVPGLGLALLFAAAGGATGPGTEGVQEYHFSLRGQPKEGEVWEFSGLDAERSVKFEPEGLRLTLPAGYAGHRPTTGASHPLRLRGTFELTVNYEILQEPDPADAGPRATPFFVQVVQGRAPGAGFTRRVAPDEGLQFAAWAFRWDDDLGKNQVLWKHSPSTGAKKGRLRLARLGEAVSYAAAEGSATEFTPLGELPLADKDVTEVKLAGNTGGPRAALDVRFTDLHIRVGPAATGAPPAASRGVAGNPDVAAPPGAANAGPTSGPGHPHLWLLLGLLGFLVLVLAPAAVFWVRRGRRAPSALACAGCGVKLRPRPGLAGKKVKCPRCGRAVPVPGPPTD